MAQRWLFAQGNHLFSDMIEGRQEENTYFIILILQVNLTSLDKLYTQL